MKALKPRAAPVGRNAFELLEPGRPEGVTHILTLSELTDAVKTKKPRRNRGRPHGVPTARRQPSALELLEPDHESPLTSFAESGQSDQKGFPTGLPTVASEPQTARSGVVIACGSAAAN